MIRENLKYVIVLLVFFNANQKIFCQDTCNIEVRGSSKLYLDAFKEMRLMLEDSIKPNFKRSVFLVENAYNDGTLDYDAYNKVINLYSSVIKTYTKVNLLAYKGEDYDNVAKNYAIFKFMTDTVWLTKDTALHYPYTYNFDDFMGEKDWRSMFVTTLIKTHKGNCHSMPYLYKILADELGAEAYLSLAPYHIYIKSRSEKAGWFNTELTNAMFPVDAWVAASGYVTLEAMRSGIYMDTLGIKQSIAFCLYDLAKGCEKRFGLNQLTFILQCLDLSLKYYPNSINVIIYRAEYLKKIFDYYMKVYNAKDFKDILKYEMPKEIYDEMESLYIKVLNLGFREMPTKMYKEWLESLRNNKEKYQNNKILYILQKK